MAVHPLPDGGLVIIIADGAGGLAGGAAAAEACLTLVADALCEPAFDPLDPDAWSHRLLGLDQRLHAMASGESTAVVVAWSPQGLAGASAGDSEAWLISDDSIDDLTARPSKKRLGSGRAQPVGFSRSARHGTLLVGTDGLFRYAPSEALCRLAREGSGQEAVARLVAQVRLPSGQLQDDVAVVLVRG